MKPQIDSCITQRQLEVLGDITVAEMEIAWRALGLEGSWRAWARAEIERRKTETL